MSRLVQPRGRVAPNGRWENAGERIEGVTCCNRSADGPVRAREMHGVVRWAGACAVRAAAYSSSAQLQGTPCAGRDRWMVKNGQGVLQWGGRWDCEPRSTS